MNAIVPIRALQSSMSDVDLQLQLSCLTKISQLPIKMPCVTLDEIRLPRLGAPSCLQWPEQAPAKLCVNLDHTLRVPYPLVLITRHYAVDGE